MTVIHYEYENSAKSVNFYDCITPSLHLLYCLLTSAMHSVAGRSLGFVHDEMNRNM